MLKEYINRKNIRRALYYGLYMLVVLIIQDMFFTNIRPFGVCPLFMPAAAIAVGMFEGGAYGAVFGLVMGVFADMAYTENVVMFTIVFPALAFATGFVSRFFINRRFFAYMGAALVGLLLTSLVQSMKVTLIDNFSFELLGTGILQSLLGLPMAALLYLPPARWIE